MKKFKIEITCCRDCPYFDDLGETGYMSNRYVCLNAHVDFTDHRDYYEDSRKVCTHDGVYYPLEWCEDVGRTIPDWCPLNKKVSCFEKAASGVILDTKTNLEWFVGPDQDTTWDEAKSWTDSLTVDGGGWRMPTIEELRGLYQDGKGSRNMDPAFVTSGWWVWSGEVDGSYAHFFNFIYGGGVGGYSYTRYDSRLDRSFAVRARRI